MSYQHNRNKKNVKLNIGSKNEKDNDRDKYFINSPSNLTKIDVKDLFKISESNSQHPSTGQKLSDIEQNFSSPGIGLYNDKSKLNELMFKIDDNPSLIKSLEALGHDYNSNDLPNNELSEKLPLTPVSQIYPDLKSISVGRGRGKLKGILSKPLNPNSSTFYPTLDIEDDNSSIDDSNIYDNSHSVEELMSPLIRKEEIVEEINFKKDLEPDLFIPKENCVVKWTVDHGETGMISRLLDNIFQEFNSFLRDNNINNIKLTNYGSLSEIHIDKGDYPDFQAIEVERPNNCSFNYYTINSKPLPISDELINAEKLILEDQLKKQQLKEAEIMNNKNLSRKSFNSESRKNTPLNSPEQIKKLTKTQQLQKFYSKYSDYKISFITKTKIKQRAEISDFEIEENEILNNLELLKDDSPSDKEIILFLKRVRSDHPFFSLISIKWFKDITK